MGCIVEEVAQKHTRQVKEQWRIEEVKEVRGGAGERVQTRRCVSEQVSGVLYHYSDE